MNLEKWKLLLGIIIQLARKEDLLDVENADKYMTFEKVTMLTDLAIDKGLAGEDERDEVLIAFGYWLGYAIRDVETRGWDPTKTVEEQQTVKTAGDWLWNEQH